MWNNDTLAGHADRQTHGHESSFSENHPHCTTASLAKGSTNDDFNLRASARFGLDSTFQGLTLIQVAVSGEQLRDRRQ